MFFTTAPARLHCALLNESGLHGRIDGGLGFAINKPAWKIQIGNKRELDRGIEIESELSNAGQSILDRLAAECGLPHLSFSVKERIPLHIGLGSKTSLLMGLGRGASEHYRLNWDVEQIAKFVGRGGTSGIGVHALAKGGVIWDVGRRYPSEKNYYLPSSASKSRPPKAISFGFSPNGLKVVHFRFSDQGLHGLSEIDFFERSCPVPNDDTIRILALIAGQVVPSLLEQDIGNLQCAISSLQDLGLKKAEWRVQAPVTLRFREYFRAIQPNIALALSSAGPTLFCIYNDAEQILDAIRSFDAPPLHCEVTELFS